MSRRKLSLANSAIGTRIIGVRTQQTVTRIHIDLLLYYAEIEHLY